MGPGTSGTGGTGGTGYFWGSSKTQVTPDQCHSPPGTSGTGGTGYFQGSSREFTGVQGS